MSLEGRLGGLIMMSRWLMVVGLWVCVGAGGLVGVSWAEEGEGGGEDPSVVTRIEAGDRVLFVGDDMTQQMFYSRATACALLAIMPEGKLRFFNGGKEGATVEQTIGWVEPLLELTRPTVVFVCLGLNEARGEGPVEQVVASYREQMVKLVGVIRGWEGVRVAVILGPAAVAAEGPGLPGVPRNEVLAGMSRGGVEAARRSGAGYIDLFEHLAAVHQQAHRVGGEPLSIGGWLPSESAHTIIASVVLRGLGVSAGQLEAVGWSPLLAADMRRVRGALALTPRPPELEEAQVSRDLYEGIRRFDDRFFRAWRLSVRKGPVVLANELAAAEEAWAKVEELVEPYRQRQRVAGAE